MSADFRELPDKTTPVVLTSAVGPPRLGLRVQHLMFVIVLCAFFAWLTVRLGAWILIFGILALVAGAIGLAVVLARRGATQQESLLWALAISSERSLPLAPAALAFADQFAGSFRARVYYLASLMTEGVSLPDALDQVPGLFSREAETLVRVGWTTGTLPHALRLAANARASRQSAWGSVASRFAYLALVLFHMQVVITFILYFILPKFEAIFSDFGVPLPAMTVATVIVGHFFVQYWPLMFLLFFAEVMFLLVMPLGLLGFGRWEIPLVDALFKRRHTTLILRALALTTEGGRPVVEGLATLARVYPSGWVRRRLGAVVREVERGGDWVESLADHALIRESDEAVLSSAQRAGNLAWALGEMAEVNERRLGYRLQLALQMLFPLLVMAIGALVFVMAVAYFSPVVRLIEVLAG